MLFVKDGQIRRGDHVDRISGTDDTGPQRMASWVDQFSEGLIRHRARIGLLLSDAGQYLFAHFFEFIFRKGRIAKHVGGDVEHRGEIFAEAANPEFRRDFPGVRAN